MATDGYSLGGIPHLLWFNILLVLLRCRRLCVGHTLDFSFASTWGLCCPIRAAPSGLLLASPNAPSTSFPRSWELFRLPCRSLEVLFSALLLRGSARPLDLHAPLPAFHPGAATTLSDGNGRSGSSLSNCRRPSGACLHRSFYGLLFARPRQPVSRHSGFPGGTLRSSLLQNLLSGDVAVAPTTAALPPF